jgi:hypothetical protein
MSKIACVAAGAALLLGAGPAAAADCDRACLRGFVSQYLDAVVAHRAAALPFAPGFKYIEDEVETKTTEGVWTEVTRLRPYRIDILDARQGVAVTLTVVEAGNSRVMLAALLKVVDHRIAQIETMVTHNRAEGVLFDVFSLEAPSTPMTTAVPVAERTPREDAVRIAQLYPAGLKIGSFVSVDVPFAPEAYRFENGRLMAGPGCTFIPGCDQIKSQRVPTLAGIRHRVLAMDEDTGVVLLDQNFGAGSIRGSSAFLRCWEAFKVSRGKIRAVEAFMKAMPSVALERVAIAEQVAPKAAGYVTPRTPWGDPDLNGVWPDIDMVRVPVQRAVRHAAVHERRGARGPREARAGSDRPHGERRRRRRHGRAGLVGGVGQVATPDIARRRSA